MSNLSAFPYIPERSQATPGLWNYPLSIISANIAALDSGLTSSSPSGNTFSFLTNIETSGGAHFQHISVGSTPPSYATTAAITVEVNSAYSDYLYFVDSSAQKSSYLIGSRAGNLADGLNIWDASAGTMIASFSKQSIRFFQNVVGPVFDVGGALASTYNAATFGGSTKTVQIQAAISQASIDGVRRVYVPANMYPYPPDNISFSTAVQMVREGGDWSVWDVLAYGAYGNGLQDDTTAFRQAILGTPVGSIMRVPIAPGYASSQSSGCYIISNLTVGKPITIIGDSWGPTGQTRSFGQPTELAAATNVVFAGARLRAKSGATGYLLTIGPPSPTGYTSYIGELDAVRIDGLYLDGNGRRGDIGGLRLNTVEHSQFVNLQMTDFVREAVNCETSVRETVFQRIYMRFCGDAATGYPMFNLSDTSSTAVDGHNLLVIDSCLFVFPMGVGLLLDTAAATPPKATLTRDVAVSNCVWHGSVSAIDGLPYTFSAAQKTLDLVQVKSANDVRFVNNTLFCAGNAPGTYINQLSGGSTDPSMTVVQSCNLQGRYSAAANAWDIWVQNGNIQIDGCFIDGGGISNVSAAVGTTVRFGITNYTNAGNTILGNLPTPTIPIQATWAGQQTVAYNNTDAAIRLQSTAANGRTYALNATGSGSGNVNQGFYFYDITGLFKVYSIGSHGALSWGTDGVLVDPAIQFESEHSLGLYRAGTSVIRQSIGTLEVSTLSVDGTTRLGGAFNALGTGTNTITGQVNLDIASSDAALELASTNANGRNYHFVATDNLSGNQNQGFYFYDLTGLFKVYSINSGGVLSWGTDGKKYAPAIAWGSNASLGWYSSGAQTIAQSLGTFNLATNAVRISMRTLATSSVTPSAANTNIATDEAVFTIGGASGASFCISSGGTTYIFSSTASAKNT